MGAMVLPGSSQQIMNWSADASANSTLTTMAAAEDYFAASARYVVKIDLDRVSQGRLVVRRLAAAGAAGAVVGIRYSPTAVGATTYNAADWVNSGISVNIATQNTEVDSGWVTLPSGMLVRDCYVTLVMSGGDGAASPVCGGIQSFFR